MMYRTYDSWKAHNPQDDELGSCVPHDDSEIEPDEEEALRRFKAWKASVNFPDYDGTPPSNAELCRPEHFGRYDEILEQTEVDLFAQELQNPPEKNE
jgi:hypothetical protein